jgi:hypothetical protein
MAFDIHQRVFDEDGDFDEEAALRYRDEIMVRFSTSPEGEEVAAQSGAVGWADTFMDYGMGYLGATPPEMSPAQVKEILFDLFPRKVSTMPGAGGEIILELRAFWSFLQREFQLANASACLRTLKAITGQEVERELRNPANFGMAKSFFMLGQESGFDMTTEEGLQAFTQAYNAGVQSNAEAPLPLPTVPPFSPAALSPFSLFDEPDAPHPRRRTTKKTVGRRKMAQTSRRKNRKK